MAVNKCGGVPEINMTESHSSDSFGYCCIDWYWIGQSTNTPRPWRFWFRALKKWTIVTVASSANGNIDSLPWKTIIIYYCTKSCVCQNLFLFFVESFQRFVTTFDGCGNTTAIINADWHILLLVIVWNVFFDMHKLNRTQRKWMSRKNETVRFSRSVRWSQSSNPLEPYTIQHTVIHGNMNSIGTDQATSSRMYCVFILRSYTRTYTYSLFLFMIATLTTPSTSTTTMEKKKGENKCRWVFLFF